MTCDDCSCSSERAPGWVALLGARNGNEDMGAAVVYVCPPCYAARAGRELRVPYT